MGLSIFDKIFKSFDVNTLKQIDDSQKKIFDDVVAKAEQTIKDKIKLDTYFFSQCHRMSPILQSSSILAEIKGIITKSIISKVESRECAREIQGIISCSNLYTREMDNEIGELLFNFYMQYDSAYSNALAEKTGLNYFMYLGGKIKDSRDFCVAHDAKVWSRDEAALWPMWTPEEAEFLEDYTVKQKDQSKVPSYLSYPGYSPLIDRGGYNCRHHLGWISDDLAKKWRPDIK